MSGKTHIAVGTAVALAVLQPMEGPQLVTGICAAVVGSVISDIDVDTSISSRGINKAAAIYMTVIFVAVVVELLFHVGIVSLIQKNSMWMRVATGIALFMSVCAFGKIQPHRSFMHSLSALLILSGAVALIYPAAVPYFSIAFISHILADLLNYKKVRLFYPLKKGISFKICHATGLVNSALFIVGTSAVVIEMALYVYYKIF
ncbi:MAG TPA: metal-dependent hydrolase [Lachnospiraceae bacterium]|nr:metal-dependent hydrolase [Lachnospiraceae bacterium]